MNILDLYVHYKGELNYLEDEMEKVISTEQHVLFESSHHLLKAGGKRLRPFCALLGGKLGRFNIELLKKVAIPIELIHMATLVHDDVVDNAGTRRGKETVKAKWDNRVAMYTGDFIFAKSIAMISELKNPRIHLIFAKAIREMCLGELAQLNDLFLWQQELKGYLRKIKRKTALLISVSFQLGALVAESEDYLCDLITRFGYYVGMAFQITDDILDYTSEELTLGKPAAHDLKEGNITLPALYTYHHLSQEHPFHQWILPHLFHQHFNDIIETIKASGGIDYANNLAKRYLEKARELAINIPEPALRHSLYSMTDFVYKRTY